MINTSGSPKLMEKKLPGNHFGEFKKKHYALKINDIDILDKIQTKELKNQ